MIIGVNSVEKQHYSNRGVRRPFRPGLGAFTNTRGPYRPSRGSFGGITPNFRHETAFSALSTGIGRLAMVRQPFRPSRPGLGAFTNTRGPYRPSRGWFGARSPISAVPITYFLEYASLYSWII
ncbi:hypothetical protein J2Z65_005186 [Paenibacillus aceris]|uniref:Uncharacterized protein n=1 Tax=Paenibacillus aceris TaxID=869555 RepID=A0ABS4I4U1_9BACL|nr:hypothetical protein [Paenibacillus aceris]